MKTSCTYITKINKLYIVAIFENNNIIRSFVGLCSKKECLRLIKQSPLHQNFMSSHDPRALKIQKILEEYFQLGRSPLSSIPIQLPDCKLSPLAKSIYKELRNIPEGQFISYDELGKMTGLPYSPRAVGQIVGRNPLPLFIPCHLVVNKNGPGGFSAPGQLATKEVLLNAEGQSLLSVTSKILPPRRCDLNQCIENFLLLNPKLKKLLKTQNHNENEKKQLEFNALAIEKIKSLKTNSIKYLHNTKNKKLPTFEEVKKIPDFIIRTSLIRDYKLNPAEADIYLICVLGKQNILPLFDPEIKKGFAFLSGAIPHDPSGMLRETLSWIPYRSIGAFLLWFLNQTRN